MNMNNLPGLLTFKGATVKNCIRSFNTELFFDAITRRGCVISLIVITDNYLRTKQHIYSTWNSLHFHYTLMPSLPS